MAGLAAPPALFLLPLRSRPPPPTSVEEGRRASLRPKRGEPSLVLREGKARGWGGGRGVGGSGRLGAGRVCGNRPGPERER